MRQATATAAAEAAAEGAAEARKGALYVTKISASHPKSFSTKCRKDQREQGQGLGSREGGGAGVARVPESALYTQRKYDKFIWNCFVVVVVVVVAPQFIFAFSANGDDDDKMCE